jgi:hypothetical protein
MRAGGVRGVHESSNDPSWIKLPSNDAIAGMGRLNCAADAESAVRALDEGDAMADTRKRSAAEAKVDKAVLRFGMRGHMPPHEVRLVQQQLHQDTATRAPPQAGRAIGVVGIPLIDSKQSDLQGQRSERQ